MQTINQSELHPKMYPVIWKWFPFTLWSLTIKVNCHLWDPLSLGQPFILGYSRKISCVSPESGLKITKHKCKMQLSVQRCSQDSSMFSRGLYCMSFERLSYQKVCLISRWEMGPCCGLTWILILGCNTVKYNELVAESCVCPQKI